MNELSLHILDIVQNSISANSSVITIEIREDIESDVFKICITDNGKGIDKEMLEKVTDPYVTSRTTRKVGMGLALLKQNAEMTGGKVVVESNIGNGTKVSVQFGYSHLDRPILGDIAGTISVLVTSNPEIDFVYKHSKGLKNYCFDTLEVKRVLEGVPISDPFVFKYLKEMIVANLKEIY